MKRKLSVSILLCMLVFTSIIFSGCAKVDYTSGKDIEGNIIEQITATLDIESTGLSNTEILTRKVQIQNIAKNTLKSKLNTYNSKVNLLINNAHTAGDTESELTYRQLLKDITIQEPLWNGDVFIVKVSFASESSYLIFYGLTERNFQEKETTENWLYNTIHYKGKLGYYQNYGLYSVLKAELQTVFPEFTSEDTTLTYSHLTQSRRYHSNADKCEHTENGYLHIWAVDDINKDIEFTLNIANRQNWYILAILIGLIATVVLGIIALIIVFIKKHKNKHLIYRIIHSND